MSDGTAHRAPADGQGTTLRITTNQGIEDIATTEVVRLLDEAGINAGRAADLPGLQGVVMLDVSLSPEDTAGLMETAACERVWNAISTARSIYHAVLHTAEIRWAGEPLQELAQRVAQLPFARMPDAGSFRVSCSRVGEHPFHSPDVEAAVGGALQQKYGTPVNLTDYEVNVRVDIVGDRCLCGYQLTGKKGLDRRYRWQYHPRVTLRTVVAYAMLEIAGFAAHPGDLHDPFCGSGTILLEAAALAASARSSASPILITGTDWSSAAVAGCRANLEAAGVGESVSVSRADARDLSSHCDSGSLDYIVTNPPFGIRLGDAADLAALYRQFLDQAAIVLRPGGVLALLVGRRRGRFNKLLQASAEFRLEHERVIEIGGVYPGLFVLRRV